jgi:3-phenylpropionate/trans-cinnamate dioxygenase ferredoxin reductase subunit
MQPGNLPLVTQVDHLLIGGGVACLQAAKQIARRSPGATILLVSEDRLPPYDLPPLSKAFLCGEKTEADLVYETAAALTALGISSRLSTRIDHLDAVARTATTADGQIIAFGKALIATGARPIRLSLPGSDLQGVHYLRSADDSAGMAADAVPGRHAVIIGAGFIGLEVAASLVKIGLRVTVFEAMSQIWPRFADRTLADYVKAACEARGVCFVTGTRIVKLLGEHRVSGVVTDADGEIACDMVCVGVGVVPNVEIATAAGLTMMNGVAVDASMQTSVPGIFAAGDVISYPCPISGRRRRAEHWGHAEYSGQIAGTNMAGSDASYDFVSYVWSDIFDMHIEAAGDENGYDDLVVRGDMAAGSFIMLYLKGGSLIGYCGVNAPAKEFSTLRKLIRSRKDLQLQLPQLRDPAINVRTLL